MRNHHTSQTNAAFSCLLCSFQTETGLFCSQITARWVKAKIQAFEWVMMTVDWLISAFQHRTLWFHMLTSCLMLLLLPGKRKLRPPVRLLPPCSPSSHPRPPLLHPRPSGPLSPPSPPSPPRPRCLLGKRLQRIKMKRPESAPPPAMKQTRV